MKILMHSVSSSAVQERIRACLEDQEWEVTVSPLGRVDTWKVSSFQLMKQYAEHYDVMLTDCGNVISGQSYASCASLLHKIRATPIDMLIVVCTEGDPEGDAVLLDAGADYCVGEPALAMRTSPNLLRAVLRRLTDRRARKETEGIFESHGFVFDSNRFRVRDAVRDKELHVTKTEVRILELLTQRPRHIFDRSQLMTAIYGDNDMDDRNVDSNIKRLRNKLKLLHPEAHMIIDTVYGGGYRFNPDFAARSFPVSQ